MANVLTISRPDVVAFVEKAAARLTKGNKTQVVAMAVRHLLEAETRENSLFGAHPRSVRVRDGVDLTEPVLDVVPDAETGREIQR